MLFSDAESPHFFKRTHWPLIPFAMSGFSPNPFFTNSGEVPQYRWSVEKAVRVGYFRLGCSKTAQPSLVSDLYAAWTFTCKRLPEMLRFFYELLNSGFSNELPTREAMVRIWAGVVLAPPPIIAGSWLSRFSTTWGKPVATCPNG